MAEFRKRVAIRKRLPLTCVNHAADALDVQVLLRGDERLGIEADVVEMVVPSRMFSECADMRAAWALREEAAQFAADVVEPAGHFVSGVLR